MLMSKKGVQAKSWSRDKAVGVISETKQLRSFQRQSSWGHFPYFVWGKQSATLENIESRFQVS